MSAPYPDWALSRTGRVLSRRLRHFSLRHDHLVDTLKNEKTALKELQQCRTAASAAVPATQSVVQDAVEQRRAFEDNLTQTGTTLNAAKDTVQQLLKTRDLLQERLRGSTSALADHDRRLRVRGSELISLEQALEAINLVSGIDTEIRDVSKTTNAQLSALLRQRIQTRDRLAKECRDLQSSIADSVHQRQESWAQLIRVACDAAKSKEEVAQLRLTLDALAPLHRELTDTEAHLASQRITLEKQAEAKVAEKVEAEKSVLEHVALNARITRAVHEAICKRDRLAHAQHSDEATIENDSRALEQQRILLTYVVKTNQTQTSRIGQLEDARNQRESALTEQAARLQNAEELMTMAQSHSMSSTTAASEREQLNQLLRWLASLEKTVSSKEVSTQKILNAELHRLQTAGTTNDTLSTQLQWHQEALARCEKDAADVAQTQKRQEKELNDISKVIEGTAQRLVEQQHQLKTSSEFADRVNRLLLDDLRCQLDNLKQTGGRERNRVASARCERAKLQEECNESMRTVQSLLEEERRVKDELSSLKAEAQRCVLDAALIKTRAILRGNENQRRRDIAARIMSAAHNHKDHQTALKLEHKHFVDHAQHAMHHLRTKLNAAQKEHHQLLSQRTSLEQHLAFLQQRYAERRNEIATKLNDPSCSSEAADTHSKDDTWAASTLHARFLLQKSVLREKLDSRGSTLEAQTISLQQQLKTLHRFSAQLHRVEKPKLKRACSKSSRRPASVK